MEDAALGRRTTQRNGVYQDLLVVLRGHEPACRAAEILEPAGRWHGRGSPQGGAAVLRLDRVSQVPRRPGEGQWPLRADPQGRRRLPDLRRRSAPKLAVPRRRRGGGYLPAAAHRAGRDADAFLRRPDRSEVPDPRRAVAPSPGRGLALAGDASAPPSRGAEPWPDQLAVQFPRRLPEGSGGMERPYFLMGGANDPVYQWRWTSSPRRALAGLARGIERFDTLPGAPAGQATYDHGEWRLVLTRALATPDTANEVQLEAGRAIPMAFFAWDGSSGEHGSRMAVSTWYFLALDRPTPPGVFISPVLAMLVTLGLGLVVVRRGQRAGAARSRGLAGRAL